MPNLTLLLNLITFPGIICHELAHILFCKLQGVGVLKVCLIRLGNPAGYVIHEEPQKPQQDILISIGPFIVNSLAGAVIGLPGAVVVRRLMIPSGTEVLLLWLGVSLAAHAFPSTTDAGGLWRAMIRSGSPLWARIASIPLILLIYLGQVGLFLRLNYAYALALVLLFPDIMVHLMRFRPHF